MYPTCGRAMPGSMGPEMARTVVRIAWLTLALGATVVLSWVAARGPSVLNGPGPFLDTSWLVAWAVQAALAVMLGAVVGRSWGRQMTVAAVVGLGFAAWVGELLVAIVISPILAGELSPLNAPLVWLIATGGPLQPLAFVVGALAGRAFGRAKIRGLTT